MNKSKRLKFRDLNSAAHLQIMTIPLPQVDERTFYATALGHLHVYPIAFYQINAQEIDLSLVINIDVFS